MPIIKDWIWHILWLYSAIYPLQLIIPTYQPTYYYYEIYLCPPILTEFRDENCRIMVRDNQTSISIYDINDTSLKMEVNIWWSNWCFSMKMIKDIKKYSFNIFWYSETPLSLQSTCRLAVRKTIGRNANRKISELGEDLNLSTMYISNIFQICTIDNTYLCRVTLSGAWQDFRIYY